jgi:hypothetical protein
VLSVNGVDQKQRVEIPGPGGRTIYEETYEQFYDFLNRVGKDGWELVSTDIYTSGTGETWTYLYLKRPRGTA